MEKDRSPIAFDTEKSFICQNFKMAADRREIVESLRSLIRHSSPFSSNAPLSPVLTKKMQFRLDLQARYEADYFKDFPHYNQDAVAIAVVMHDRANNVPASDKKETLTENLRRSFNAETVKAASAILTNVIFYVHTGLAPMDAADDMSLSRDPEGIFCAHIAALESLKDIGENLDETDIFHLSELKDFILPAFQSFANPESAIGLHLNEEIDRLRQRVQSFLPTAKIFDFPAFKR